MFPSLCRKTQGLLLSPLFVENGLKWSLLNWHGSAAHCIVSAAGLILWLKNKWNSILLSWPCYWLPHCVHTLTPSLQPRTLHRPSWWSFRAWTATASMLTTEMCGHWHFNTGLLELTTPINNIIDSVNATLYADNIVLFAWGWAKTIDH